MTFFSLLTDPKVLLLIAVLALLIALGVYAWRQSGQMEELKLEHDKMIEQVKHGIVLSESKKSLARLRPDMVSNMSEETATQFAQDADDADVESEGEGGEEVDVGWEDEEHNAYIKEIIRINDSKRAKCDDYYVAEQQQSGHNGPVYDSGEEEIVFDNYADDSTDESAQAEILAHVAKELNLAREATPPQVPQIVPSTQSNGTPSQKPKPLEAEEPVRTRKPYTKKVKPIPAVQAETVNVKDVVPKPEDSEQPTTGKIKVVIGKKAT
jgi:hypothetical protein